MNVFKYSVRNSKPLYKSIVGYRWQQWRGFATFLIDQEDDENILQAKYEPLEKLPSKPPFMKNVFQGKYDTDFLAFPEFLGEKRLKMLDKNAEVVRKFIDENVSSAEIDETRTISKELMEKMRELKLFGLSASKDYGGVNFTNTERARIYEIISQDPSIGVTLFNHETCGQKLIAKYGNDYHRNKYLKLLVSGQILCTACYGEAESGSDPSHFDTYALRVGTDWLISGSKVWVMNADKADLFIVFAKVKYAIDQDVKNYYYKSDGTSIPVPEDMGVFLVEKGTDNLVISSRFDTFGIRGVSMHEVIFNNVTVSEKNVLTDFKRGYQVVKEYLTEDRFLLGCLALGTLKNIQSQITDYSIKRKLHGENLYQYGFIQNKISDIVVNTYAIESLIYYTAGLLDMYDGQDCEIESAIVKVFCSEAAFESVNSAMLVIGGQAFLESSPYFRYFRDLRSLTLMDSTNDVYRCLIALNGLQYVSNDFNEPVFRNRNPFFYPLSVLTNFIDLKAIKVNDDNPKLHLKLKEFLHPSLQYVADHFENCVIKFEHGVLATLSRIGPKTVDDQFTLKRLADCAILIYAMTAVLSRASRSYCIGCRNADEELVIAETFIRDSAEKFKYILPGLLYGEYYCTDANQKKLAEKTVKTFGYFAEEPLKLTY